MVMVTFETEGAQGLFEMVHAKILLPTAKPVIVVEGERELVMMPDPEISVQLPLPTAGVLEAMVTEPVVIQIV